MRVILPAGRQIGRLFAEWRLAAGGAVCAGAVRWPPWVALDRRILVCRRRAKNQRQPKP
jgi:hypothetical protein